MTNVHRPKRIGVDGSALVKGDPTGVEQATTEMLRALFKLDTDNQYFIYTTAPLPADFKDLPNVIERIIPHQRFWTQTALPRALKRDNLDVFWSPSNILPPQLPKQSLATVHDIAFVKHPECYSWWNRILQRMTVLRAKSMATRIIAITKTTKDDLERYMGVPASQIDVVPMAMPSQLSVAQFSKPMWDNYILVVGRVETKKNSINIIKAFSILIDRWPNLLLHLIFVGKAGYQYDKVQQLVQKLNLQDKIHFIGYAPNTTISELYHHARLLLSPSLYEGFGMTILEGFAAGIPVVTSDVGAMKEVANGAAILVDPNSPKDIARGTSEILDDQETRQKYIKAGRERLQYFSWDKSASKIKDIINNL